MEKTLISQETLVYALSLRERIFFKVRGKACEKPNQIDRVNFSSQLQSVFLPFLRQGEFYEFVKEEVHAEAQV